jgi:hypothetical protein
MTDPLANPEMTDPDEGDIPPGGDEEGLEIVQPTEIAAFLSAVYRDEDASNFERTQAAVGLSAFWMGVELNRMCDLFHGLAFIPATDTTRPSGGLL